MNLDLDTIETTFDLVARRGEELMDVFYAGASWGRAMSPTARRLSTTSSWARC